MLIPYIHQFSFCLKSFVKISLIFRVLMDTSYQNAKHNVNLEDKRLNIMINSLIKINGLNFHFVMMVFLVISPQSINLRSQNIFVVSNYMSHKPMSQEQMVKVLKKSSLAQLLVINKAKNPVYLGSQILFAIKLNTHRKKTNLLLFKSNIQKLAF